MELLILLPLVLLAGLFGDSGSSGDPDPDPDDIEGTPDAELVAGTNADDTINAGDGDDTVNGLAGDDVVSLGAGDDIYAYSLDIVDGQADSGNDTVFGGAGDDILFDAAGADVFYGGAANDIMLSIDEEASPTPADTLYGDDGNDSLLGDDGDRLYGGAGADRFGLALAEQDRGDQWVRIMDFDPATEVIEIDVDYGPPVPVVTFEPGANGGTRILVNGTNYAVVEGVAPDALTPANIIAMRF